VAAGCALKAKRHQIQLVDEGIDNADRIVRSHIVVEAIGEKSRLPAILTFNETAYQKASREQVKSI
jgi:hypothetical protein